MRSRASSSDWGFRRSDPRFSWLPGTWYPVPVLYLKLRTYYLKLFMASTKKRVGIVLFQLGGPDSLATVEPFLRNLFLDPDIIPLGPANFIRGPLARYIAKKRTPPVAARYAMIGRRSP